MLNKSKRLVVIGALAALAATAAPASPANAFAMSNCQVKPLFSVIEYQQSVAVTGAYAPAGAIDVELTCGVVRYGSTARRVSETAPGPVGVVATVTTVGAGPVSSCIEARVTYVDHVSYVDTCP